MKMQDTPAVESYRHNIGHDFSQHLGTLPGDDKCYLCCIQTLQGPIKCQGIHLVCVEIQFFAYAILCKLFYAGIPS